MKILSRYLVRGYLLTFGFTVAVFTFILVVGAMVRVIDLLARGISAGLLFRYMGLNIPFALQFTVPMSVMTTSLLLFTRLSLDGELTAMKACGLSLWRIVTPVLLLAMILSAFSFFLTQFVSPRSRFLQRHVVAQFRDEDPLALVEEGRFIRDFPGHLLFVGRRDRRQLYDIVLYERDDAGRRRNIRAQSGTIERDESGEYLEIDLYQVRIESMEDPAKGPTHTRSMTAEHLPRRIHLGHLAERGFVRKRISDHTLLELHDSVRTASDHYPDLSEKDLAQHRMGFVVEASNRTALSFACFAFTLLGIPLGMRSRRRESSIGVVISLGIAFFFYFFMILTQSLARNPDWRPEILVWIPVVCAEVIGLWMIHRTR